MNGDGRLAGVAARGVFWVGLKAWITRGTSLLVFVYLTRVLTPQEIGLVAFAYAVVAILASVSDMGLADYLIFVEDDERARNQIFWLQSLGALALGALVFSAAPWVLPLIGKAEAVPVMQTLCWMIPLSALGKVHDALQRKALDFRSLSVRSLFGNTVSAAVGFAAAYAGFGLWALVAKQLLEVALDSVLLWATVRWRPSSGPHLAGARPILAYGSRIAASRIMDTLSMNVDDVIVGIALGSETLGFYSIGKRIFRICADLVGVVLTQVAGPLFASQKHDAARMNALYLAAIESASVLVVPLFGVLAAASAVLLPWVFGEPWRQVVPVSQWFCLIGAILPLTHFNWGLLQAQGQSGRIMQLAAVRLVVNLGVIAVALPFGMLAVVVGQVLRAFVLVPVSMFFALKGSGMRWFEPFARALPGMLIGAIVAGAIVLADAWLADSVATLARLLLFAAAAVGIWTVFVVALMRAGRLGAVAGLLRRRRAR
jgi:O-antigen/teichoic acid export membrane protein